MNIESIQNNQNPNHFNIDLICELLEIPEKSKTESLLLIKELQKCHSTFLFFQHTNEIGFNSENLIDFARLLHLTEVKKKKIIFQQSKKKSKCIYYVLQGTVGVFFNIDSYSQPSFANNQPNRNSIEMTDDPKIKKRETRKSRDSARESILINKNSFRKNSTVLQKLKNSLIPGFEQNSEIIATNKKTSTGKKLSKFGNLLQPKNKKLSTINSFILKGSKKSLKNKNANIFRIVLTNPGEKSIFQLVQEKNKLDKIKCSIDEIKPLQEKFGMLIHEIEEGCFLEDIMTADVSFNSFSFIALSTVVLIRIEPSEELKKLKEVFQKRRIDIEKRLFQMLDINKNNFSNLELKFLFTCSKV